MAFKDFIYESDSGVSFQIRLDSDQQTVAGGVVGASDVDAHVRISSSRRDFGVQPRFITARRAVGEAPNEKILTTKLAICTTEAFDAIAQNSAIQINGIAYAVASKTKENTR